MTQFTELLSTVSVVKGLIDRGFLCVLILL